MTMTEQENTTIQEMRDTIKRLEERAKSSEKLVADQLTELKGHRISKAGYSEGSPGFQILTDFYDGDLTDIDAMKSFAGRYGHQPADTAPSEGDTVEAEDTRLQLLQRRAAPAAPANQRQQLEAGIAEAEEAGDTMRAIMLKSQLHLLENPLS
jgi:hypothetical protein